MVKGVSRQVIVVHSPGEEIFDQAIFILREEALGEGVTDEQLLKQAKQMIRESTGSRSVGARYFGPLWAFGGAAVTALLWGITALL